MSVSRSDSTSGKTCPGLVARWARQRYRCWLAGLYRLAVSRSASSSLEDTMSARQALAPRHKCVQLSLPVFLSSEPHGLDEVVHGRQLLLSGSDLVVVHGGEVELAHVLHEGQLHVNKGLVRNEEDSTLIILTGSLPGMQSKEGRQMLQPSVRFRLRRPYTPGRVRPSGERSWPDRRGGRRRRGQSRACRRPGRTAPSHRSKAGRDQERKINGWRPHAALRL